MILTVRRCACQRNELGGWNDHDTGAEYADAQKLPEAYATIKEMVADAWYEADAKTPTFKRWFAESDAGNVKKGLERGKDMTVPNPEAQPRTKDRILRRNDYRDKCRGQPM
jgi:hypothetical protein